MPRSPRRRPVLVLTALAGLAAAPLWLAASRPAAAMLCPVGSVINYETFYYNQDHTKIVGECTYDCNGIPTCTGKQTNNFQQVPHGCCPIG